jgi:hypothetical protein
MCLLQKFVSPMLEVEAESVEQNIVVNLLTHTANNNNTNNVLPVQWHLLYTRGSIVLPKC